MLAIAVTRWFLFWNSLLLYLQFFLVEGLEQVLRNNLIEAFLKGQKLSLDAMQEAPVHIQPAENRGSLNTRGLQIQIHHHDTGLMIIRQSGLPQKSRVTSVKIRHLCGLKLNLVVCCRHILVFCVCASPLHTWHTPSWCPLWRGHSCRWVWAHVGWFLRRHCAPHRKCGPGRQWCHCPWRGGVGGVRERRYVTVTISSQLLQKFGPTKLRRKAVIQKKKLSRGYYLIVGDIIISKKF